MPVTTNVANLKVVYIILEMLLIFLSVLNNINIVLHGY